MQDDQWTVKMLWVGPKIGPMEWASMQSFLDHGAKVELYSDDIRRIVPDGVQLLDCKRLLGNNLPRYGRRAGVRQGSYAIAADVARLKCLHKQGGWWVDTDVICLKPFTAIDNGVKFAWEDTTDAANKIANLAVLRLPKGSILARILLRRAYYPWLGSPWEAPITRLRHFKWLFPSAVLNPYNVPWGWSAGPTALTSAIRHYGLTDIALEPRAFYPVHPGDWRSLLNMSEEAFQALEEHSYAVHLWAENFKQASIDKAAIQNAPWAHKYLRSF